MVLMGLIMSVGLSARMLTAIAARPPGFVQSSSADLVALSKDKPPSFSDGKPDADHSSRDSFDQNSSLEPFDQVVKHSQVSTGLFTLYRDGQQDRTLLGIKPDQLNQNLLLVATLRSGLGEAGLVRGMSINDLMVQFRRITGNRLQVVVPNVMVRDSPGRSQPSQLLRQSFSDSLLLTLDMVSIHPRSGEMLIDLKDLFINQDPINLSQTLNNLLDDYELDPNSSYLGDIKVFPGNVEIQATFGFLGSGKGVSGFPLLSLPDGQGFSLGLYYSLSVLPNHPSFHPRPADQRVGYFTTAYRQSPRDRSADGVVRYINRWHLEKQDPGAALSPPQKPLVFWLENTIPAQYRQAIREGVEWWNEAFEQIGFAQAIEVRQMPDHADWDPADIRYNVIRWSDSWRSLWDGLGQARVNPLTGEILDADVLLDANLVSGSQQTYQTLIAPSSGFSPHSLSQLCGQTLMGRGRQQIRNPSTVGPHSSPDRLPLSVYGQCLEHQAWQQIAFGALAIHHLQSPLQAPDQEELYLQQFLRLLAAHEVGHVLGLRHNFLGSTLLAPADLNNRELTRSQGMLSSVMDYAPPNIAPPGQTQGDYFSTRLGAYDLWAIEYGYKPLTNARTAPWELQQIANRSGSPELAYATDEETFDGIDPISNAWDLSRDPLHYAASQMAVDRAIWAKLNWFSVNPGESFGVLRQRVDSVFFHYLQQAMIISNYIGGERFKRTNPWDLKGQRPFEPIPAEVQREALTILERDVFSPEAISLSPDLVDLLAPDLWLDSAQTSEVNSLDYPLYDQILGVQALTLSNLLLGDRLERLRDVDLKPKGPTPLTLSELFDRITHSLWKEIFEPVPQAAPLSSLRRGLQQYYLNLLTDLTGSNPGPNQEPTSFLDSLALLTTDHAPEEARVLARYQMNQLQEALASYLHRQGGELDTLNRAYLENARDRINRTLHNP